MRPSLLRMRSSWAYPAGSPFSTQIRPSLTSVADEVCATVARLFAYLGTLALVATLGVHFFEQLPHIAVVDASRVSWSAADRSDRAFALSSPDQSEESVTYTVLRHPEGGRKDILRFGMEAERPRVELEIYRIGSEGSSAPPASADLALRMPGGPGSELEAAGVIDSKFGTFALVRRANANDGPSACLGFFREIDDPSLRISGWSCEGSSLPDRRSAVACMLDRLTLLSAGNEPKMAELFTRAGFRRRSCGSPGSTASGDWITDADNPHLRGAL